MKMKAMVTKIDITNGVMVVLTKDRQFKRLPLPENRPCLGQTVDIDIAVPNTFWHKLSTSGWAAAAVAVLVFVSGLFGYTRVSDASTYITLDMKPSVRLAVDSGGTVKEVRPLNSSGEQLVKQPGLVKKDVYAAVEEIMYRAAQSGYFQREQENVVMAGVSAVGGKAGFTPDVEKLRSVIYEHMSSNHYPGYVVINDLRGMDQVTAAKSEVSANKLILVEKARQNGVSLDPEALTDVGMTEIISKCASTVKELFPESSYRVTWQKDPAATAVQGVTPRDGVHRRGSGGMDPGTNAKMPDGSGRMEMQRNTGEDGVEKSGEGFMGQMNESPDMQMPKTRDRSPVNDRGMMQNGPE